MLKRIHYISSFVKDMSVDEIKENSSFVDDHSYFKFKCTEDNFKKLIKNPWNPDRRLKKVISELAHEGD